MAPQAATISFRLGGDDGVSVEARKWESALRELGFETRRIAGEIEDAGRTEDVSVPGLAITASRPTGAQIDLDTFHRVANELSRRGVIGRFSTFLEHVKPLTTGEQVTRYNALFHWAVPAGREIDAGRQVGRFHIMTHAYWREAGEEFGNVNIMGVAHGTDKDLVLAHKRAIDEHLQQVGIPVSYTNVFWGGRSEIKPSEIAPAAYRQFCLENGIDPETMRE